MPSTKSNHQWTVLVFRYIADNLQHAHAYHCIRGEADLKDTDRELLLSYGVDERIANNLHLMKPAGVDDMRIVIYKYFEYNERDAK
jgi:hypothetical protein